MKLLVLILNNNDKIDPLLKGFSDAGIKGGTIIESKGMGQELMNVEEFAFFGSLRKIINPERASNHTILVALHNKQVDTALEVIKEKVGDLEDPNTGVLMIVPIEYSKGIKF